MTCLVRLGVSRLRIRPLVIRRRVCRFSMRGVSCDMMRHVSGMSDSVPAMKKGGCFSSRFFGILAISSFRIQV